MTAKRTVSLTDQGYEYAKSLVDSGRFSSLSAGLQHGLRLVEWDEAEHQARLGAIRSDLERRAGQPPLSTEVIDERLREWRTERGTTDPDHVA